METLGAREKVEFAPMDEVLGSMLPRIQSLHAEALAIRADKEMDIHRANVFSHLVSPRDLERLGWSEETIIGFYASVLEAQMSPSSLKELGYADLYDWFKAVADSFAAYMDLRGDAKKAALAMHSNEVGKIPPEFDARSITTGVTRSDGSRVSLDYLEVYPFLWTTCR